MRHVLVALAIASLLMFTACGGKKPADLPKVEEETVSDTQTTAGERPAAEITDEQDITTDTGVKLDESETVGERPLSDMTLDEINAAEFLKNVFYDFDKYDLTQESIDGLEQNGRWLMANASVKVIIEGHCDERGTDEYNLALGEKRANAARDFLIRFGVESDRLMTASYGESRPFDPGHDEAAWAMNRRAHFRVFAR